MKNNLLTTALLISFIFSFSQASLVKDIMVGSTNGINITTELFKYNDKILFKSFGGQLAVSDGTETGTFPIRIGAIGNSSTPDEFTLNPATNEVLFSADGPSPPDNSARELWKTDGTLVGTSLVYDFTNANGWNSNPRYLCEMNGIIYCRTDLVSNPPQLGYSDGTFSGSGFINTGSPGSSAYPENLFAFNGNIFFTGWGDLWISDGTQQGTSFVKNINLSSDSDPDDYVVFNNKLYFTADDGIHGRELWVTDGTANGTQLVVDVNNGPSDSNIQNLTVFSNKLYFSADSSNSGNEIHYITTSESLILYRDINPGSASSNPSNFKVFNGQLYFSADNGTNGIELWRADGSVFGIGLFKDINTTGSSSPIGFQQYNGNLYFSANDGTNGEELWMTDGTASGTVLIADINPGAAGSLPRSLVDVDGELLFHAVDVTNGRELWKYFDPALSVSDLDNQELLKLSPNPAKNSFTISNNLDVTDIAIYDVQGKLTKQFNNHLNEYIIEDLSPGLYFVKIKAENREETLKLMKQ
jgi:ELWxxDGT repeat protein